MNVSPVFAVAGPHVVADEVEGEIIVINLDNGAYFSFRDSASLIWRMLLAGGASLDEMVEELCARYQGEREEIFTATAAFVKVIESEGLVAVSNAPRNPAPGVGGDRGTYDRVEFVVPTFEKYTDMEEFLLVDPIHEVDVSEWPAYRKRE